MYDSQKKYSCSIILAHFELIGGHWRPSEAIGGHWNILIHICTFIRYLRV